MEPRDRYTCEEVFRRLDDYVDRELSAEEVSKLEDHLAACAECASEYRFEADLISAIKSKLSRIVAPQPLIEKILAALVESHRD